MRAPGRLDKFGRRAQPLLEAAIRGARPVKRWVDKNLLRDLRRGEALGHPLVHAALLRDRARLDAFRRALALAVRPGDVVVDVGAGTGILSHYALEAGASKVYAIESGAIAHTLERAVKDNGFEGKVIVVPGYSTHVELPEAADVVVAELLSSVAFDDESLIECMTDARQRFLRPRGRLVPCAFRVWLAPIQSNEWGRGSVPERVDGYALEGLAREAYPGPTSLVARPEDHVRLAEPRLAWEIDLAQFEGTPGPIELEFPVETEGRFDGLLGWFDATLYGDVSVNNRPGGEFPSWTQMYFPADELTELKRGTVLKVEIEPKAEWPVGFSLSISRA